MDGDWLPPQAPGDPPPPPPDRPAQPPQPPPPQPPPAYQPPPPPQPPPPYQQQPPQQYPYPYPPQQPGYPYGWQPLPPQPPNNDAVAGFTCAVVGAALLFFTAGVSTLLSLGLGIAAIVYGRKGKKKIADGETRKHKDLANAGYVIGIVTTVLSILATVAWTLIFALVDWDEYEDDDDPFDDDFQFQVALRVLAAAARLLG